MRLPRPAGPVASGLVVLLVAVPISPLAAQAPAAEAWADTTARLERAVLNGSVPEIRTIRADLLRRLSSPAEQAKAGPMRYAAAYAGWRLATQPAVPKAEQHDLLEDAVKQLQLVLKAGPQNAEAHALLGSVYGLQIAESPITKGMTLGPRATAALDRAAQIDATSPRVLLLQGVSAFNTPAIFGGGTDKAERLLRRSLERFGVESAGKEWPNWGRFDAHAWLGQALLEKGDRAGARAAYDKAREIAPDSGWLRYVLVPALDAAK